MCRTDQTGKKREFESEHKMEHPEGHAHAFMRCAYTADWSLASCKCSMDSADREGPERLKVGRNLYGLHCGDIVLHCCGLGVVSMVDMRVD